MRAGAQLLMMAADPVNRRLLHSMLERPFEAGPGRLVRVSDGGHEALFISANVEAWLERAPGGPLEFESAEAQAAVGTFAAAWSSTVVHMLAREPLGFGELHRQVEDLSRRALRRQLEEMERCDQLVALPVGDDQHLYMLTDWLRAGIAPLIISARLERRNPAQGMTPIDALDVEAGFRLSLPLIQLPAELTGTCRLRLNLREAGDERPADEAPEGGLAGVTARIEQGEVVSCEAGIEQDANAWAVGTAGEWLDTVIEPDVESVRTGDDRWLADAVVRALHETLFGAGTA